MSIHAISGKPGGGKTLYSVKLIIEELIYGSRVVVTNVPLLLPMVNEYLQKEYPNKTIDVMERLRLMTDDEAALFWTYRPLPNGAWARIEKLTKEDWTQGKRPDYQHINDSGVLYAIDEIHNFFNARAWMETGRDVLFYLSQHRKMGDTVIWITQAVANVDKQFRSVTQDYTYLRNLSKERMGLFKLPAMFVRKTYGSPATDTSEAMESGTFKLDVSGLASLYDTAAGVGIHGRKGADTSERNKGIHWLWFVILVPAIIIGIYRFAPSLVGSMFSPDEKVKAVQERGKLSKGEAVDESSIIRASEWDRKREMQAHQVAVKSESKIDIPEPPPPIYMEGYIREGMIYKVYLSDGTVIDTYPNMQIQQLTKTYVVWNNQTNFLRPKENHEPKKTKNTRHY